MYNTIFALPITLNRKPTIYTGADGDGDIFFNDGNVILCSDGTNVELWDGIFFDTRRLPFSNLMIELDLTVTEFMELTEGENAYVDLVLFSPNMVSVFITTQHDVIYDEVHTLR